MGKREREGKRGRGKGKMGRVKGKRGKGAKGNGKRGRGKVEIKKLFKILNIAAENKKVAEKS